MWSLSAQASLSKGIKQVVFPNPFEEKKRATLVTGDKNAKDNGAKAGKITFYYSVKKSLSISPTAFVKGI